MSEVSRRGKALADLAEKMAELEALHIIQAQQRKLKEEERLEYVKALEKVKIAEAKIRALEEEEVSFPPALENDQRNLGLWYRR